MESLLKTMQSKLFVVWFVVDYGRLMVWMGANVGCMDGAKVGALLSK